MFVLYSQKAECDPSSTRPCCNEQTGECGNGKEYCNCIPHCTDYNHIIQPEFANWIETYQPITNYTMEFTCKFLQDTFSEITFIGDSLVRHLFSAFLIHLTNDTQYGALKHTLSRDELHECQDEKQFFERKCRTLLELSWKDIRKNPKYCPGISRPVELNFKSSSNAGSVTEVLKNINLTIHKHHSKTPLFIVGIGIHDQFKFETIWYRYVLPIIKLIHSSLDPLKKPKFIWLSSHANYFFLNRQSSSRAFELNQKMRENLKLYNIPIMDNFRLTHNIFSFDGTHFGRALNGMKCKLLIKTLRFLWNEL